MLRWVEKFVLSEDSPKVYVKEKVLQFLNPIRVLDHESNVTKNKYKDIPVWLDVPLVYINEEKPNDLP